VGQGLLVGAALISANQTPNASFAELAEGVLLASPLHPVNLAKMKLDTTLGAESVAALCAAKPAIRLPEALIH
jgi:hypothetical protein